MMAMACPSSMRCFWAGNSLVARAISSEQAPKVLDGRKEGSSAVKEDIRALRLKKAEELRSRGSDPYAYSWNRTHKAAQLQDKYTGLMAGEEANQDCDRVSVAGRIVARRTFGKLAFLSMRDESSSIQLYCDKGKMKPGCFEQMKATLDIGDIVGATGTIKRTEKGELSVYVDELSVLTKSLLPLPEKWHGLTDIEKRYRQRYLDMIMNPEVADVFRARSNIIAEIRKHVESLGFLEIETPILQGAAGGAEARPFITYHNALERDLYLRIATELHLKRMLVGGFERVYEIGRIFRNEGISTRHNPEFTSIELYQAYADYNDMMDMAEELVTRCATAVLGKLKFEYQGEEISLQRPWRRASMRSLVQEATGIDFLAFQDKLSEAKSAVLSAVPRTMESGVRDCRSIGKLMNEVFEGVVEKTLIQPTFVTDHPVEVSPLAKQHRNYEGLAERFELYICGRELANAFSELTDPVEQRRRFEVQIQAHNEQIEKNEAYKVKLDDDFLTALEYGMPPTAGMGIGIDRLVMLLTNSPSIKDVIAFPMLKSFQ